LHWSIPVGEQVIPIAHSRALCEAAVTLAAHGRARAIVAVTRRGQTARVLSAYRPPVSVLAVTDRPEVARRLALHRGVVPFTIEFAEHVSATEAGIESELLRRGALAAGDVIVFVRVHADLARRDANFLHLVTAAE
jgi:pyruvate kinase